MESLPWPAITAASGGWFLFAATAWLVIRRLVAGDLLTRREADGMKTENERLWKANAGLLEQNGLLLSERAPADASLIRLLERAAESP